MRANALWKRIRQGLEEAKGDAASFTLRSIASAKDQGMMLKPREMPLRRDQKIGAKPSGRERTLLRTALAGQRLDQAACLVG